MRHLSATEKVKTLTDRQKNPIVADFCPLVSEPTLPRPVPFEKITL